jgi:malonyl-CoA/methylmalonyl-CoA synthetase
MKNALFDALIAPRTESEAPFLHFPNGGIWSYSAFVALTGRYANTLSACGVRAGDRLALQVAKSPQALAIYVACLRAGVIFLPLNTGYTPSEMAYFIEDATPRLVICDPSAYDHLAALGPRTMTLDAHGSGSFSKAAQEMPQTFATVARTPDDLAAFLYTSGTTGRSKGAMLTHENLLSNARALRSAWQFTPSDVLLHALPIFHAHGLFVACNVILAAGASMIFLPKFDPDAVLEHLPRATTMMGVPTFYTRLLDTTGFTKDRTGHMRLFTSGSAPLLAETHEAFEHRTGHRILERYGMTETGMNTSNPYHGARRAGSVGPPLEGVEVIVTDPQTGAPLDRGQTGMIEVRGPNVFKGYWKMPEKTAEELRNTGFLITGDLGHIDTDGYVHIVGRQKDLIISGGYNIYPKEVELLLDDQSGVRESAVIGVPHPDFGEAVVAVIVPDGTEPLSIEALMTVASRKLANYKRPKKIVILNALPRNTMGKVQKNVLRAQNQDIFKPPQ